MWGWGDVMVLDMRGMVGITGKREYEDIKL